MSFKISVITINYNEAEGLDLTIRSVIDQTYKNLEYLVIDGGSTDGSFELIRKHEQRIDHWISEPDQGVYHAMNKGIAKSTGEYLLFLNSGDRFHTKGALESLATAGGKVADLIYGSIIVHTDTGSFEKKYSDCFNFDYFLKESLPHPATLISRGLFEKVGSYFEQYKVVSDWAFFMLAILQNQASYFRTDVIVSDFHLDGVSSDPKNIRMISDEKMDFLREYFPKEIAEYRVKDPAKFFFPKLAMTKWERMWIDQVARVRRYVSKG